MDGWTDIGEGRKERMDGWTSEKEKKEGRKEISLILLARITTLTERTNSFSAPMEKAFEEQEDANKGTKLDISCSKITHPLFNAFLPTKSDSILIDLSQNFIVPRSHSVGSAGQLGEDMI